MKGSTGARTACDVLPVFGFANRRLLVPFSRDPVTYADKFAGIDGSPELANNYPPYKTCLLSLRPGSGSSVPRQALPLRLHCTPSH